MNNVNSFRFDHPIFFTSARGTSIEINFLKIITRKTGHFVYKQENCIILSANSSYELTNNIIYFYLSKNRCNQDFIYSENSIVFTAINFYDASWIFVPYYFVGTFFFSIFFLYIYFYLQVYEKKQLTYI